MDLVDSSSERLVQQLNERANRSNPAWILYVAAVALLAGLGMVPDARHLPNLPDVTLPLSTDRTANTVDEYSALTARYGEPNSIVFTEADPLAPIPVATAQYSAAHIKVTFVPNGCVAGYGQVMKILGDVPQSAILAKRLMRAVPRCHPSVDSGWTTVAYLDSTQNIAISSDMARVRLDGMPGRQTASPVVERSKPQPASPAFTKKQLQEKPEMKSNDRSRLVAEKMMRDLRSAEARTRDLRAALLAAALGLFFGGLFAHKKNTEGRKSRLFYELDEAEQQKHDVVQQSFGLLAACHCIWRIEAEGKTSDWKRNAGASSLVRRTAIGVSRLSPPRVETNIQVPCVNMGRSQMYFLPDTILYRDGRGYGAIGYNDFRVAQGLTRFIESDGVPSDAIVVDHTWRYVNKNGGPDRRFNNNRQLPVLQLGVLEFKSSGGLNIQLNTSNPHQSLAFADCWRTLFQHPRDQWEHRTKSQPPPPTSSNETTNALRMLGLSGNPSRDEISVAYRRLAQMYHPDKVAGLAPEFQLLADKRMKEINAAYEAVRTRQ